MALAGNVAPDISYQWFHTIRNDIKQGFLYPLNEWIGEDTNGNGQIDDEETKWEPWKRVAPLWRRVATVDGKVYAVPKPQLSTFGVLYRIDLVRAAGLDPNKPPETWEQFYDWCRRLTDPGKEVASSKLREGQRGLALESNGFLWLPWVQSAGGDPIIQIRKDASGRQFTFPMEEYNLRTPDGRDLTHAPVEWRAQFASPAGIEACAFYHRLRWGRWMIDPQTRDPITLDAADLEKGEVSFKGRTVHFVPSQVITGVLRNTVLGREGNTNTDPLLLGEVGMRLGDVSSLIRDSESSGVDPTLLGWFPVPAGPQRGGRRVVQQQQHYYVMFEGVGRRPKVDRDAAWKVMECITDTRLVGELAKADVLRGLARFIPPKVLADSGLPDYLDEIPDGVRKTWKEIDEGKISAFVEPFVGHWFSMDNALNQQVLSLILSSSGEDFDYRKALLEVEEKANGGVMFGLPESTLQSYRVPARIIFSLFALGFVTLIVFILAGSLKKDGRKVASCRSSRWIAWLMASPAFFIIAMWGYYPLLRGLVMAFQDYKLTGNSEFVGLDNFIILFLDSSWWATLWRTLVFVGINMALGFTAPIVVALLLSEVPFGKLFYRTLFFLPQVTSGLVIVLLWRLMYEPTPQGFLNQALGLLNYLPGVHVEPQTWLEDPKLAMVCCIIPGVWAGMGMASLIYLAALKGVPEECYEAAELDGAGILLKIRHITLPTLLPLIIINFVGAFIGTFQSMGNILLLTFGGPGDATVVAGLRIWTEAYTNVRFSMATTMAWTMGAILICFTYLQIRILRQVEFRRANWN